SQIRRCLPGSCGQRRSAPATLVATVTVMVVVAPSAAVAGFTTQVAWAGIDVQVNATVPGTPAAEERSNGYTASPPAEIVAVVLPFAFSVKSTPVPVNCRLCGEDTALSVTVKVPVRVAAAVG